MKFAGACIRKDIDDIIYGSDLSKLKRVEYHSNGKNKNNYSKYYLIKPHMVSKSISINSNDIQDILNIPDNEK
ncbi:MULTISPECIES: hypothetical protein [Lactobacillus]|uniref:Uncharacterized protein n=1 Tax=Lactobacillus xujianguonis TaxID=2495899 RepID=A0A437SS71_9LACO|nr:MULTISPECIES: hypothetical protein [Lactobacillus]RVU69791.1 hypothetical protein EJK17_11210 [Lactobacillus xujianguonis]RVU71869.1 hypothetical protein EJK20_11620 [Lactobacillus xujianguonis]